MISGFSPEPDDAAAASAVENVDGPEAASATPVKREAGVDLWKLDEHDPDAQTLAAPAIVTNENIPAQLAVNNKKSFDYLVRDSDKRFRAEKTPVYELGLRVECTVRSVAAEPNVIELAHLKISQTTLDGREPIAGLDLDVGKPIISKRSVETSAHCVLGQTRCVPIATTPGRQALLLVRVSRAVE